MMTLAPKATLMCAGWIVAAWRLAPSVCGALASAASPPTVDDVIAAWEQNEEQFFGSENLFIHSERTENHILIEQSMRAGAMPAEYKLWRRGANWAAERRFAKPFSNESVTVSGEPLRVVINGGHMLDWEKGQDQAFLNPFDFGGNIYGMLQYTKYVGLNAPKFILRSQGHDELLDNLPEGTRDHTGLPFLPDFLRAHRGEYRVAAKPDRIDGRDVCVVEWPGMDKLWVDPARGFAAVRREYSFAPGKPLKDAIFNSDYREVKPGLWLPFAFRVDIYGGDAATWGKVVSQQEFRLHKIDFDPPADEIFNVSLPVGTYVVDMVRDLHYHVTGKNDTAPFAMPVQRGMVEPRHSYGFWIAVNLAIAVAIVSVLLLLRRRARPNEASGSRSYDEA
jgi:hypothetical protein